ncbi:unnamed protein product [Moneuplotes crassus]|uniref:Uncharacterized protein n=1 Tax=Euplotes crassus TaxID=5936 RepID=A0AAD1UTE2_EUPCR|nr:unnamed protein product [Moneuplotes crassus]
MNTARLDPQRYEKVPKFTNNQIKTSSLIQLSKGNDKLAKAPGDFVRGERKDVVYKDKDGEDRKMGVNEFDPNHSEFYGTPGGGVEGRVPISQVRYHNLPVMHRPVQGIKAYKNPNGGTNRFRSIYEPKPMPPEMKPGQNPDWLYTRKRGYARPLLYEPMEKAKRTIPLAGKLATTSISRYDRYQLPENNLPVNPQYSGTIAPIGNGFAANVHANITRSKKYTQLPLNQRYLYNNETDIEKKFYDGELEAHIASNNGVRNEQYYITPYAGSLPEEIQKQLPSSSRNISSHVPLESQMKLATHGRTRNKVNLNAQRVVKSYQEIPQTQSFGTKIETRRGDKHLESDLLKGFDDPDKYSIKF